MFDQDKENMPTSSTQALQKDFKFPSYKGIRDIGFEITFDDDQCSSSFISQKEPNNDSHKFGCIVAATLKTSSWWPAIIVDPKSIYAPQPKKNHVWVLWMNTNSVSQVNCDKKIKPFQEIFYPNMLFKKNRTITKALYATYSEIYFRYHSNNNLKSRYQEPPHSTLFDFAQNQDVYSYFCNHNNNYRLSDVIKLRLEVVSVYFNGNACCTMSSTANNESFNFEQDLSIDDIETLEKWKSGSIDINGVCISCWSAKSVQSQHPYFHGSLCKTCMDCLMETFFAICDQDDCYAFCAVCGNGGELLLCSNINCRRVYCKGCMKNFYPQSILETIYSTDYWKCELCCDTPSSFGKDSYLVRRDNWQSQISKLFLPKNFFEISEINRPKKPLRVLSLFDGISTGKVVLDKLNIDIEAYYSSEIEQNALAVSQMNFSDIIQLGDVKDIDQAKLESILPIDLVMGGSPCNDLSSVNPARKGIFDLNGTGYLFFEFYRILNLVKQLQPDNIVFWVFENVASMSAETRQVIDRFLQCSPALWGSVYFSPQHRARLLWGNIPGLYSPPSNFYELKGLNLNLDDILIKNLNRKAKVSKLRTITTMPNSLTIRSRKNDLPIEMNGENSHIWVTEVERVFGLPTHFTDTGYLSASSRQKLLGKAWSVDVFKHLLQPLTQFFTLKPCNNIST